MSETPTSARDAPDDDVVPADGSSMDAYDYGLPQAAIAQRPVEPRSAARLLIGPGVVAPAEAGLVHATVAALPQLLRPGDVLVVNDTRVLPARLELRKASGGRAEVLLLEPAPGRADASGCADGSWWTALVRPGRRLPPGTRLFEEGSSPEPVVEVGPAAGPEMDGRRRVRLLDATVVDRVGQLPLPPYVHAHLDDPDRYQTVYARAAADADCSVAAPTAGLHLTPELLAECEAAGARIARVDLAIGLDTFRPVTADRPADHVMHSERYSVPPETLDACRQATRVVAVGTTVVRALESAASTGSASGRTDLYIWGDYRFEVVDLLVTNFHLPRSSLLLLVEAFCGPVWRSLYATALAEGYRFLSFGDAMVVARRALDGATTG